MSLRREWLKNNGKVMDNNVVFTKSTQFVMPMIGYELSDFLSSNERINHLINCYLVLGDDPETRRIVIVLDNVDDPNIGYLLRDNDVNPYFQGSSTDDEDREIVLFYSVPEKWEEDFNIFLTSRYSKMSNTYKNRLVDIYGRKSNTKSYRANQFDVIYPTPYKKQQWAEHFGVDINLIEELSSKLDMNYECYKTIDELLKVSLVDKV